MAEVCEIPVWKSAKHSQLPKWSRQICFNKKEMSLILAVYSRQVMAGEWCDYCIEISASEAVFSVFKQYAKIPSYRIIKCCHGVRKYRLVKPNGRIISMGVELKGVLGAIDRYSMRLV